MANILDLFDPARQPQVPPPETDMLAALRNGMQAAEAEIEIGAASATLTS